MDSSSRVFILSAILMLLVSKSMATVAPSELVEDVCTEIEKLMMAYGERSGYVAKYDECVNALQMDPRTATANITTLAEISVQLAISGAKNAEALIEHLLGNTTPSSREPLQNCLSSYVNITGHFENALSGLNAGLQSSNFDIAGVLDLVKICELELTKNQTHILQLTNRNHYTRMFVEISEFLITRLELYHIANGFTQTRTQG
ncbi:hypothetical protein POTOM_009710 [Populus tomentosa]|uniref:Pectinesterase inhibitor domain-containing protein n=1 Tax=Populus tomentosa TaxID=118781 RepID=A0A8X8DAD9_POPTO|nr:hypothetical protein POTOM_009710 [Populus tomentosa]